MQRKPNVRAGSAPGNKLPQSQAERRVQKAISRFDGLQAQVENLEARVASYETGGVSPSVWAAAASPADPEVEEALQQLKDKLNSLKQPESTVADTPVAKLASEGNPADQAGA